jgi:hypothetical protein
MTSSRCIINLFHSLVFMKVNVKKQHSSSIETITCTTSLANLMCLRIHDEEGVLFSLVREFTSKLFYIGNFELFFMVKINKNICRPKTIDKSSLETHKSLVLNFLTLAAGIFENCQMTNKPCFKLWL